MKADKSRKGRNSKKGKEEKRTSDGELGGAEKGAEQDCRIKEMKLAAELARASAEA